MKAYRRLGAIVIALFLLGMGLANVWLLREKDPTNHGYRVEISRAAGEIRENGLEGLDLSAYPSLVAVEQGSARDPDFLKGGQESYEVRSIEGVLYRFDYRQPASQKNAALAMNLGFVWAGLLLIGTLLLLRKQIILPFERLRELPFALSKGNLTMPLQQEKNRYFGRFLWGMDLLRQNLESQKQQTLDLQKEKKTLILSLAHDIKTPLSAIKLYSQALGRNLYREPEKQAEAAGNIGRKVDEIEGYLEKITAASREDFLHLQVNQGEFYAADVMEQVRSYYADKLTLLKIPFSLDYGTNCLLKGDRDRVVEIFQNLMENAIKYGEGGAISIRAAEEGNCRIFTVANQNCSLPEGELAHIFESFWRGSNGEKVRGSGLGLYICRQLIRAMGGDIFAQIHEGTMEVSIVLQKI